MKFKDPVLWSQQELELQADETSRKFLKFFTTWFDKAEAEMVADHMESMHGEAEARRPVSATREAFTQTEAELGFLSMEFIGQMLLLASIHWEHGDRMLTGLSPIELRMVEQMTAIKLVELQEMAAKVDP